MNLRGNATYRPNEKFQGISTRHKREFDVIRSLKRYDFNEEDNDRNSR